MIIERQIKDENTFYCLHDFDSFSDPYSADYFRLFNNDDEGATRKDRT